MSLEIEIQPTPNPNALKFVLEKPVKTEGSSSYRSPVECIENPLAYELFTVRGVDHIHFFDNVITITKFGYEIWQVVEDGVVQVLEKLIPTHDPNYHDADPEKDRRKNLSPELSKIEEILDKTIRPGLQGDGGDIQCIEYRDDVLVVKYQGACGTCPSSSTGTLEAIKAILRDEFNPEIEVYIAPEY